MTRKEINIIVKWDRDRPVNLYSARKIQKKFNSLPLDDNIQAYNMLDKYKREHYNEKMNRRSLMGDINLLYEKNMLGIINEIDEKFEKVYKNNREIVKNYLEKNEEEVK